MHNPALLRALAWISTAGALFPIIADVISWLLAEDYSPIANSISALAVGPSSWLIVCAVYSPSRFRLRAALAAQVLTSSRLTEGLE